MVEQGEVSKSNQEVSHTEISNTMVRKQAKLYQKPVHAAHIQLFSYSMHPSQPPSMGTLRAVPRTQ